MASRDEPTTGDREVVNNYSGTGVTPVMIVLGIVAVLFVVFLAQNGESVPVEFLGWDVDAPLNVVVLVALVASALATLAVAGIWRRRRRRSRTEREELQRLRSRG